jgi:hypothetical protein
MNRALAFSFITTLAAAAACADSSDETGTPPVSDDAGNTELPAVDAGPDVVADATPDADVDAALPTCTDDGWCLVALPNARSLGLRDFKVKNFVMDEADGVWVTTASLGLSDGSTTSHVWHYEQNTWHAKFGVGPLQSEPFPYELKGLATNGSGTLLAVGGRASWNPAPYAAIVRIENGVVTTEYPEGMNSFVSVVFTSSTEAWAIDDQGSLFRTTVGGTGPLVWTLESSPNPPLPDFYMWGGPTLLLRTPTNGLLLAGNVPPQWGKNIPSFTFVDQAAIGGDGSLTWTSTRLPEPVNVYAGVEISPSNIWLASGDGFFRSSDASGALEWARDPKKFPREPQSVWAGSANDIWTVTAVGRVYHYDGTAWTDTAAALNGAPLTVNALTAITGRPSGELWIGGQDVVIHRLPPKAEP